MKKARASGPCLLCGGNRGLLQLGFLVEHVLARLGIVFLDLHLVGRGALVLGGGIEVAGAGGRFELDLVAHQRASFCLLSALALAWISASTASSPSLSIFRRPAGGTRSRTQSVLS